MFNWFKKKEKERIFQSEDDKLENIKLGEIPCSHQWMLWKMTEDANGPVANMFCGFCGQMRKINIKNGQS